MVYLIALFHPYNTNEFVSGGWDSTVQFWDMRMPNGVRHISDAYMCGDGLDISKTGTDLLVCSYAHQEPIKIFDYQTNKKKMTPAPDKYLSQLYAGM